MKKIIILLTILLCSIFFTACGQKAIKDEHGCFVNYEDALKYSKKKKLPLLVFFTSDDANDLSSVTQSAVKNYAVLHADFSQSTYQKTVVSENATAKDQELANTYTNILQNNYQLALLFSIESTPAVFLCTKDGYVVAPVESDDSFESVESFEKALNDCKAELEMFDQLVADSQKGSVADKVAAIDTLYMATSPSYRTFLVELIKKVPQLDKKNETGLCGRYIVAAAESEAIVAYSQGDVVTAIKKYLQAAENDFVEPEEKQECFYTAAYLSAYSGSDDYDGILTYLQTAYNIAPESAKAEAIKQAIEYFNTIVQNQSEIPE